MKIIILNTTRYISDYLGRLFGKPLQTRWINALLEPIKSGFATYELWRWRQLYLNNITSQVISIEGYLNDQFDDVARSIFISGLLEGSKGVYVGLETEAPHYVEVALESEATPFLAVGLESDALNTFYVNVPVALTPKESSIMAAVSKFKTAGKGFTVRYF